MPKTHSQTKRQESYPVSNARNWGTRQEIAHSHPWDPVINFPKQEITNGTGGWTVPAPREGPRQSKFWVYQLKPQMTEEVWGTLNSPSISLLSFMRKLRWPWKSSVSKFYSLLIQGHITLFSLLLQESLPLRP
jgi:hypothetical protein